MTVVAATMATVASTPLGKNALQNFTDQITAAAQNSIEQVKSTCNSIIYKSRDSAVNLPDIAKQYSQFQCREAAEAMKRENRNKGKIVELMFQHSFRGYVVSDRYPNIAISETGVYFGYMYEGIVHCNIYPEGLPLGQWVQSFHDASGLPPKVIFY